MIAAFYSVDAAVIAIELIDTKTRIAVRRSATILIAHSTFSKFLSSIERGVILDDRISFMVLGGKSFEESTSFTVIGGFCSRILSVDRSAVIFPIA